MKTTPFRARRLALALLSTAAWSAGTAGPSLAANPAGGATKLANIPAEHVAVSPGGVDMRTGRYAYSATDLAIGGDGDAGLALTRIANANVLGHADPFGNLSDNWDIMLTQRRVDISNGDTLNGTGSDYRVVIHFAGRSETFLGFQNGGLQQQSKGPAATLTWTGDHTSPAAVYTFTATDGTVALFRPIGGLDCGGGEDCAFVSQITQPDGTLLSFDYDYDASATTNRARLRTVTSSRGYALMLEGSGSLVTKACVLNLTQTPVPASHACPSGVPTTSYTYQGSRLSSVTDAGGGVSTFNYNDTASTIAYTKPDQQAPWLTNTIVWKLDEENVSQPTVSRQDFADGQIYTYAWRVAPMAGTQNRPVTGGSWTDKDGHVTLIRYGFYVPPAEKCMQLPCPQPSAQTQVYQVTPGPEEITDPMQRTARMGYCDPTATTGCIILPVQWYSEAESNADPDYVGIKTELTYDMWRNVIQTRRHSRPGTSLPDIVTSATYDCSNAKFCAKPTSVTDARSNTTSYVYAPEHGGLLTETGPAVSGVTPQTRYTYQQRYAWVSNGAGGYVQAAAPVWLLIRTSLCKKGNPASSGTGCALGASDEVITAYDYGPDAGPNNLLLRSKTVDPAGLNLRTCYAYDPLGNKIAETTPRGGCQ